MLRVNYLIWNKFAECCVDTNLILISCFDLYFSFYLHACLYSVNFSCGSFAANE